MGAGRDPRLLEDLHARGLRDQPVPQADVRDGPAAARARLSLHYSTFDPAKGGDVLFGPAGRPLSQLPLEIDAMGELRAGGNFSGPVGPSWWGVRNHGARS